MPQALAGPRWSALRQTFGGPPVGGEGRRKLPRDFGGQPTLEHSTEGKKKGWLYVCLALNFADA
jgi:hypothetical protein